jgi:hypothetical protein
MCGLRAPRAGENFHTRQKPNPSARLKRLYSKNSEDERPMSEWIPCGSGNPGKWVSQSNDGFRAASRFGKIGGILFFKNLYE